MRAAMLIFTIVSAIILIQCNQLGFIVSFFFSIGSKIENYNKFCINHTKEASKFILLFRIWEKKYFLQINCFTGNYLLFEEISDFQSKINCSWIYWPVNIPGVTVNSTIKITLIRIEYIFHSGK